MLKKFDLFGNMTFARFFSEEGGAAPDAGGGGAAPEGDTGGGAGSIPAQTAEPASQTQSEPTTFDFTKYVGQDGSLKEGWKSGVDESIRHELSLDTFKTVPEAIKQLVNAQKMIGKDKVVIPNEKSTQAEIDYFYNAIGRPQTPDGYKYEVPNDVDIVDMSKEAMKPVFDDLHKAGATQKVVDAALGHFHKYITDLQNSVQAELDQQFEEAEAAIKAQAGDAFKEHQHLANLLITENSPTKEFEKNLVEAINDNSLRPYLFSFLAGIQKKYFGTHGGVPANDGNGIDGTPAGLEARAMELQATPGYIDGSLKNSNPAQYNNLTKQIKTLYDRIEYLSKNQK